MKRAARPPPSLPAGGKASALNSIYRRLHDSLSCLDHGAPTTAGRGRSHLTISNPSALRNVPIHSGRRSADSAVDIPLDNSASNSWTVNCISAKKRKPTSSSNLLYVTPAPKKTRCTQTQQNTAVKVVPPSATPGPKHSIAKLEGLDDKSIEEKWRQWSKFGFGFQGRPSTEALGWRRLTLPEILHLSKGSFFILVVPGDHQNRNDDPRLMSLKREFLKRILHVVYKSDKAKFDKFGRAERASQIREHMESINGIIRHDQVYLEFPPVCRVCLAKS
ncbi:hypothetical protein THAOC_03451 [Thalassiosira oceanica]|uniref:Uncharacterized protein n=1 Tax=Thalassiosira oceanica TaxID=159749 RepID=K0TPT3_THAOC|nr:hypothetical protein THAOC_03451 [Thalassiosira oceanica]|eukprot:EJK74847.1 hypothetical protein THAOC_03451 [Thalassiosira oceanica]